MVPQVNVREFARERRAWRGTVAVAAFERLGAALSGAAEVGSADANRADAAIVSAALDFVLDEDGRPRVKGTVSVVAPICCSRCAETVDVDVKNRVDFRVVATEAEVRRLMPEFDAVVSEDERMPITALIEDDILLGLPATGCPCGRNCPHAHNAVLDEDVPESGAKPFRALGALLEADRDN